MDNPALDYSLHTVTADQQALIWLMLQYAAQEESLEALQWQPELARYAAGWGRAGDMGIVAIAEDTAIGTAWLRQWSLAQRGFGFIDVDIPEMAIAVLPDYRGQGVGTQLIIQLLWAAQAYYPAVCLNVRAASPALRLYQRLGFRKVPNSDSVTRTGEICVNLIYPFASPTPPPPEPPS